MKTSLAGAMGIHAILLLWLCLSHFRQDLPVETGEVEMSLTENFVNDAAPPPAPTLPPAPPVPEAKPPMAEATPPPLAATPPLLVTAPILAPTAPASIAPPAPRLARVRPSRSPGAEKSAGAPRRATAAGRPGNVAAGAGQGNGAVSGARYVFHPKPDYPAEAKRLRQQGLVLLSVTVDAAGRPASVAVARGSGFPLLDEAAVEAVRRWTFEPARAGGVPVASRVEVPVRFNLAQA